MEAGQRYNLRSVVLVTAAMLIFMSIAAKGQKESPSVLEKCVEECYPKCNVTRPLWCATLCIGKCKHSKSIPDNLCNCTYTCARFRCTNVGSDPEKVKQCVKGCSKLCSIKM